MISQKSAQKFLKSLNIKLKSQNISIDPSLFKRAVNFSKEYSKDLDLGHNFNHIALTHNISLRLLDIIAQKERINKTSYEQIKTLVIIASLLHDCASQTWPGDKKQEHADQCAELAYKKLREWNAEKSLAEAVQFLISTHTSHGFRENFEKTGSIPPFSKKVLQLAAQIIYDADHLQTVGLFGVMRGVVTKYIKEEASMTELVKFNSKQVSKLKLEESLELLDIFGDVKNLTDRDIDKKLELLRLRIEKV